MGLLNYLSPQPKNLVVSSEDLTNAAYTLTSVARSGNTLTDSATGSAGYASQVMTITADTRMYIARARITKDAAATAYAAAVRLVFGASVKVASVTVCPATGQVASTSNVLSRNVVDLGDAYEVTFFTTSPGTETSLALWLHPAWCAPGASAFNNSITGATTFQRVQVADAVKAIPYLKTPIDYGLPPTPLHAWSMVQGADAQLVYGVGSTPNLTRGSSSGADAADFAWGTGVGTFDGGDYASGTVTIPGGNNPFTMVALLKWVGGSNPKAFIVGAGATNQAVGLAASDTGNMKFTIYGGDVNPSPDVAFGSGYRLAIWRYGGAGRALTLFTGKTQAYATTLGADLALPTSAAVALGKPTWANAEYLQGDIGLPRFYSSALTTDEISRLVDEYAALFRSYGIDSIDFPALPAVTPAFTSLGLQDSIGVATHFNYTDSAYWYQGSLQRTKDKLVDLGIRRVRDGIKKSPQADQVAAFKDLKDTYGVKATMVMGDPTGRDGQHAAGESATLVTHLKNSSTYAFVDTLEGPNEWDLTGSGWPTSLASFYSEYKSAIRGDTTLNAKFPVVYGGSFAQQYNITSYADTNQEGGTIHPYPGGETPEDVIDSWLPKIRQSTGAGKPVIATEMGYNNATATSGGNVGVTEAIQAHYSLREAIYNLGAGVTQSFFYQFIDFPYEPGSTGDYTTNIEKSFGLLKVSGSGAQNTWTLVEKPVYQALKRLLASLADAGSNAYPTSFNVTITGKNAASVVIPISRKDGTYYLAVWQKNSLWNTSSRAVVTDTTTNITLTFPSARTVTSTRPSVDATTTSYGSVSSVVIPADGKVTLVKVATI